MRKFITSLPIILLLLSLPAAAQEFTAKEWVNIAKCTNNDCYTDAIKAKGFKYSGSGYEEYHSTMIYSGPKSYGKEGCAPVPNKVSRTLVGRAYVLRLTTFNKEHFNSLHDEFVKMGFTKKDSYESDDPRTVGINLASKSDPTELELSIAFSPDGCTEYTVKLTHWDL